MQKYINTREFHLLILFLVKFSLLSYFSKLEEGTKLNNYDVWKVHFIKNNKCIIS